MNEISHFIKCMHVQKCVCVCCVSTYVNVGNGTQYSGSYLEIIEECSRARIPARVLALEYSLAPTYKCPTPIHVYTNNTTNNNNNNNNNNNKQYHFVYAMKLCVVNASEYSVDLSV